MNTSPQFSPDGASVAFVTTNTKIGLLAPRGLGMVPVAGGETAAVRAFPLGGAWIGEMQWARDSPSIFVLMNEGTFATGAHMFEMPVVRVNAASGAATQVVPGATVNYSISVSRDGARLAYRAVEGRSMGDVYVQDLASGARTRVTRVNPQLDDHALGPLEAGELEIVRRDGDLGPVVDAVAVGWEAAAGDDRLLPRRPDRRRDLRPVSAVRAYGRAGGSVSDRGVRERRLRRALSDAARRLGLRRGRAPRDHQRVGRSRLQGHHGRRRCADRARHRGSGSARRDGRLVRRLHDQLDRDADRALQGGGDRPQASAISPTCITCRTAPR